jgi:TM2 domain-containing membrane protein YozV
MKNRIFFLSVILFVSFQGQIFSQDIFSPQNRLKFANKLFEEKDYFRAVVEYNEYLKTNDNDTVRFNIARAYFGMKKYSQAADNFKTLFSSFTLQDEARFGLIKSNFFSGDFQFLRKQSLTSPYFTSVYGTEIERLINLTYLLDKSTQFDAAKVVSVFPENTRPKLMDLIQMKINPQYKSPTTAALLSALVPGLGKIYVKEYTDGLIAFAATGLSVFLAADNFNSGHNFKGWLFAGAGAFFYGGSIYGSASAAQVYNAGIKLNFENELNIFLNKNNFFLPKEKF